VSVYLQAILIEPLPFKLNPAACPIMFQRAHGYTMDGTFAEYVVCLVVSFLPRFPLFNVGLIHRLCHSHS